MKLLIVDDEVIIRTGLSTVIPWAENGFSLLPAAASAEEALMRIPVERPELILTDIRMTGASGLEMSSEVLASYPDTEVIVLSGYDEFAYAQQAIRQGVSEYLLKTSGPDEILQAALRARDRRRSKLEREESRRMQSEAYYGQQISRLLGGGRPEPELLEQTFDWHPALRAVGRSRGLQLWLLGYAGPAAARGLAEEAVQQLAGLLGVPAAAHERGWLLAAAVRDGQELVPPMRSIVRKAAAAGVPLHAAGGEVQPGWDGMEAARRTALHAYSSRYLAGSGGVVLHAEVSGREGMRTVCSPEEEREIARMLQAGRAEAVEQWTDRLLECIRSEGKATPASATAYFHSVLIAGCRWLDRSAESVGAEPAAPLEGLEISGLEEQPRETLITCLLTLASRYRELASGGHGAVRRACEYIREHLSSSLSLQQVARHVHMNPTYFSELFKREAGLTYLEFVTAARMERARDLLLHTPAKVARIAAEVGYEDAKHFNKLFKTHSGCTPTEFRQAGR